MVLSMKMLEALHPAETHTCKENVSLELMQMKLS
jgi:hypothetical protein